MQRILKYSGNKISKPIFKEVLIVISWIVFGALTLWFADGYGLLSTDIQTGENAALQVDFPTVYQLWEKTDAVFVDTRSETNFKKARIPGAVNVPINKVKQALSNLPTDKDSLLITYCANIECPNAYQLMNILFDHGYRNVKFFPRGLKAWQALGHPLETE